jgi:enoyl-CoA hydratase/carnithine racemase
MLKQIRSQATEEVSLVREGPIYFLVLTKPDNTFSTAWFNKVIAKLDEVDRSNGAAVLVTIGSGGKIFSTGFDLNKASENILADYVASYELYKKLLSLSVPSLCVMSGHTYAGGLFLAACHDLKVLKSSARICMSEINAGVPFGNGYSAIAEHMLDYATMKHMMYGETVSAKLALKRNVVDAVYETEEELVRLILSFAKEFAPKAIDREKIRQQKINAYLDVFRVLDTECQNPDATVWTQQIFFALYDKAKARELAKGKQAKL